MQKFVQLYSLIVSMQLALSITPASAQSWSAWKELGEEQSRKGELAQAESSWRKAYDLLTRSSARDVRLYISALALAKILTAEKKAEEALALLKGVCNDESANGEQANEEYLACLKAYAQICAEKQNTAEEKRTNILIEELSAKLITQSCTGKNQKDGVTLLFGNAAKDNLYKVLGQVKEAIKQKNFSEAESELNAALAMADSTNARDVISLVLREQGKLYCLTKDFKRAEATYLRLANMVSQESGPESQQYLEVLGTHARLMHLLGDEKRSAAELAKCEAISSKFKITPAAYPEPVSGFKPSFGSGFSKSAFLSSSSPPANTLNRQNQVLAMGAPGQPSQSLPPRYSGRLKVIEFYATW